MWWHGLVRRLVSTVVLLGIASLLAVALAFGPSAFSQTPRAWACGLGATPTMLANTLPAIPTPVTLTSDPNQPVGFFPGADYGHQPISFTEDLSSVPNAPALDSLQLHWDFGDGSLVLLGPHPQHVFAHAGSYAVHVTIYDSITGAWDDFDSATITIGDQPLPQPPIAKATADKALVGLGEAVTFDATGSRAQVGTVVSYTWNFGDAEAATGPRVTHVFGITGPASVTLIVTDSRGVRSTAVVPVQIVPSVAHVQLSLSPTTVQAGQTVTLVAQPVNLPPGDHIAQYTWVFGDQTEPQVTSTNTITHRYVQPGTYLVQVQVVDSEQRPGVATAQVRVQAVGSVSPRLVAWGVLGFLFLVGVSLGLMWHRRRTRRAAPLPDLKGQRRSH
jgi:PKD repeat protein